MLFSCFPNDTSRATYNTLYPYGYGNASDVALGQIWQQTKILADACTESQAQNGRFVGTAFTARDMMQIVDALDEDGLLRYWGFSYGTLLGATAAAMFPDRIDKLVLDGVVNIHEYYHEFQLTTRAAADDTLMGLSEGCVTNPDRCPLAKNRTAEEVQSFIFDLIDDLKFNPVAIPNTVTLGGDIAIDYATVKGLVYPTLYDPYLWPLLTQLLNAITVGDAKPFLDLAVGVGQQAPDGAEAQMGIHCSDTFARASSLDKIRPYLETLRTTRLAGDIEDQRSIQCAQWPFAAKERYTGDFVDVQTRGRALVIGNTWDPATPLTSAKNVSLGLRDSVLLEQHGYGVSATS